MRRGFTVLETFVVVAIITAVGVLFFNYVQETQKRSRDAARIASVREIAKALALYQTGNSHFPASPSQIRLAGDDPVSHALIEARTIPEVPLDPLHPSLDYLYNTDEYGRTYNITFCLETDTIPEYKRGCENVIKP